MKKSFSDRSISGFIWLLANSGLQSILKIVFLAVLARLLTPSDFGLMASGMIVIRFTETLSQLGIGPALVQNKDLNEKHIYTALSISLVFGIFLYLCFLFLNTFIAVLFNMPELKQLLDLLCLLIPIRVFTQVFYSTIQRKFMFKKLAGWDALSYSLGYGIIGISMAFLGYGVYSLAIGVLAQTLIFTIALFVVNTYPIRFKFYLHEFKQLIKFGTGFTLSGIFNYLARNLDYFIVGKYLGAAQLGIYSRAYSLMNSANSILGRVINEVMFVSFADIQDDKEKLIVVTQKSINLTFLLIIPVSFYVFFFAEEIVLTLLGVNWTEVILPFKIMIFSMIFRVSYKVTGAFLRGIGKVYVLSIFQFIYMTNILVGCLLVYKYGINYIALVVSFVIALNFLLQISYIIFSGYLSLLTLVRSFLNVIPLTFVVIAFVLVFDLVESNYLIITPAYSFIISAIILLSIICLIIYKEWRVLITEDGYWLYMKLKLRVLNK